MTNRYPNTPELAAAMRDLEAQGRIECFDGAHGETRWRLTAPQCELMQAGGDPSSPLPTMSVTVGLAEFCAAPSATTFDIDVPFGLIDADYNASDVLVDVLIEVADLDDLQFRFWCAMVMATNLSTLTPCDDAEQVVVDVIGEAFAYDGPIDQSYRPVLDASGQMAGVLNDAGDQHPADDWEALCFAIASLTDVDARASALVELAEVCALTEANEAKTDPITTHSLWRAEMRQAAT